MKLDQGVGINVKNNEMTCMSSDFYDMNKIIKNLLDNEEIDKQHEPAVYVNQYCYRSTAGRVYNVMFFFNSSSLTANIAIQQLHWVIMACEMAGSRVMGFICDGGGSGSMQRLFLYLRKEEELPEVSWLPIRFVRFRNPYDPTRWIYMFHCATHNLKNGRGQIWPSLLDDKKLFLDADDVFSLARLFLYLLGFVTRIELIEMHFVRLISST